MTLNNGISSMIIYPYTSKMAAIYWCAMFVLFVAAEPGTAIQCYECESDPGQEVPNCVDPFNDEGIQLIDCDGKCFANSSSSVLPGLGKFVAVERGCMSGSDECPTGCIMPQDLPAGAMPPGAPVGSFCSYCCEDDMCNSQNISETAAAGAGEPINCWQCEMNVTDNLPSGSCASDDFNGEGATSISCRGRCVTFKETNDEEETVSVKRDCDPLRVAPCEQAGFTCCEETGCNVGENANTGGDVESIQCYQCNATVTEKKSDQSACYKGKDDGKVECSSGKCTSYIKSAENGETFFRDCLLPEMNQVCDAGEGNNTDYKDVKCCTKNLCNGGVNVVSVAISILSACLVSICLAFM